VPPTGASYVNYVAIAAASSALHPGAVIGLDPDPTPLGRLRRFEGDPGDTGAALGLRADIDGHTVDLGDGGLTTWTAHLLGDRKERCLVSCIRPSG
jgi:hypothetical protein